MILNKRRFQAIKTLFQRADEGLRARTTVYQESVVSKISNYQPETSRKRF